MTEHIRTLHQQRQILFQTLVTTLWQYVHVERTLRNIETSDGRSLSPSIPETLLALLCRLFAEATAAIIEIPPGESSAPVLESSFGESPRGDSRLEDGQQETLIASAPSNESFPNEAPSPPQATKPKRTIRLNIDRYLTLEEDGEIVTGKRTSKSRWIIFGLLLAAEGGKVPLSTLVRHVPVWAALLKKNDEPDEGAVKRMLSKMNTLDLRPLGVPYTVKTKKDRKTGVLHVFLDGLNDASARGYGRP